MNLFELTIAIVIAGLLAISLVYSFLSGRQQRTADGNMDSQIAKPIQKHAYISNPIFVSYGIFFALLLFIIFFIATAFY
ncbi:hypothetical protein [Neobacillus muris]|uniref:hypothetical protein n=1 Tax=Neobacillus muris TaxID=2941334 RepID=UPI0020405AA9|nr:hypothetical protein [Neobacillus muris]